LEFKPFKLFGETKKHMGELYQRPHKDGAIEQTENGD
jgi:hypothetical protein